MFYESQKLKQTLNNTLINTFLVLGMETNFDIICAYFICCNASNKWFCWHVYNKVFISFVDNFVINNTTKYIYNYK